MPEKPDTEAAIESAPTMPVPVSAETTSAAEEAERHRRRRRRRRRGRRDEAGNEIRPSAEEAAGGGEDGIHIEGVPSAAEPAVPPRGDPPRGAESSPVPAREPAASACR